MEKCELLVPAGNMDALVQAVYNGADAVYLAGIKFGARKYAPNFTEEELIKAIRFCHLYGVKIYVTMNTLVKDSEVEAFIDQARFLHQNGVDALIVQDFGMICLLREKFPNLELHASTQFNNSSKETIELLYDLGVKRVVLSREMTKEEIDAIKIPIEKEAFIHGALCISYSGCCLMSSMVGGRSGNRGECAGCCRMPYTLMQEEKEIKKQSYLLSTKELNTSNNFDELLKSSIYSFKIEGRMKSPLYVAFITRLYRKLIEKEPINLKEWNDKLKIIFNREFTKGRILKATDKELMNTKTPNHIGLEIATATPTKDKIKIELKEGIKLNQYDAIRFMNSGKGLIINFLYDEKLKLCSSAEKICYIDNKINLKEKDQVSKTQEITLEKEFIRKEPLKKLPINWKVEAKINHPIKITITDETYEIMKEGDKVEKATKTPVEKEIIEEKLNKLGNTPFLMKKIEFDMDENIFISMKSINELRRELVDELIKKKETAKRPFQEKEVTFKKEEKIAIPPQISASIQNKEQLETCLKLDFDRIYVPSSLYEEYKNYENVYLYEERCTSPKIKNHSLISDYQYFNKKDLYGNYSLNITNIYTAHYVKEIGLENVPLSVELEEKEVDNLIANYEKKFGTTLFEVFYYGRVEDMIIKGNILELEKNRKDYYLLDSKKKSFPTYYDGKNTHILHSEIRKGKRKKQNNIALRFDFYNETAKEIIAITKEVL